MIEFYFIIDLIETKAYLFFQTNLYVHAIITFYIVLGLYVVVFNLQEQ